MSGSALAGIVARGATCIASVAWVLSRLKAAHLKLDECRESRDKAIFERDAAVDLIENLEERTGLVVVWAPMLRYLLAEAPKVEALDRALSRHREALERIADGHARPAKVAADALEKEQRETKERRRTWAVN